MIIRPTIRFVTVVLMLFGTTVAFAQPRLNGLASNVELNKERFIAALYLDELTQDADAALNNAGSKRMELKVTQDRMSSRSLNSMWIEGMAINAGGSDLEKHAENLAKLTNMVRKRLVAGDTLRLDANPGNGVVVSLNGVELGTINSEEFFPILMRTWIGRVPLSSDFKSSLLAGGDVDANLSGRYATLAPTDARIATVSGWSTGASAPKPGSDIALAPPPPSTSIKPPAPELAAPTIDAIRANPAPVAASLPKAPSAAATNSRPAPAEQPKPAPVQVAQNTPKPAEPKPAATPKPAAPKPAAPKPQPAPAVAADDDDEEEEAVISAASLLERQFYISDSLRKIQSAVKYPRRALDRGQTGTIRLAVTVDRGGKVQDVQAVEESEFGLLNRAAEKAVGEAAPLPELPSSVTGDDFTFTVPITFNIR